MAIYFFDKNQTLIKIVPESATFEAIQTQELDDDSLLKDILSVTTKGDEKLLDAEYMAVKSYTGNAQTFDMYRIITDTTPNKTMSFTGMSLAPYELNGYIIQDLRPTNHTLEYTLNRILNGTDWRLGYIDSNLSNVTTTFYYVSAKEALKELQSLVGCEFVFKVEISGQKITDKWIEVYKEMGNRTKKRFNYGTNALTVVRETNKTEIYTALIGRGKGEEVSSADDNASGQAGYGRKITFEDIEWSTTKGNPVNKPIGQYYLELPQATQAYGIKNIDGTMTPRIGIVDFDDEEDKNRLINLTYQQLLVSSRPKVLFKSSVANIGATGIGDTITIHRHDLNIHYQTRVRKIVRDKLNDNKTQIELGDAIVTPSTKQTKQNNATIKNLNQELEKVKVDVIISQTSADGKNTINYGSTEPERKRTGDTWYRPHPSIAGETQMLVWNGTAWELVIDSSDLTSVAEEVEEAIKAADEAVQSANDADVRANEAIEKAGANANLLTTHQNTLNTIKNTTIPNINSSISDAMAEAKSALTSASSAMDEDKKADGKIADYVTRNGLVSGTTVDSKIDTATGEISRKITTVESKIDGLQVGGRNLIKNGDAIYSWVGEHNITSGSGAFVYMSAPFVPAMYQIEARAIDDSVVGATFGWQWDSKVQGESIKLSKDWQKATALLETSKTIGLRVIGGLGLVELRFIKAEKGNVATDWTPAPEDNYTQEEFKIFESTYKEDVKGINSTLTDLSNKKLDGSTYTTFYNNEYKKTAQGVTDTYTKVNKIIDANGNSTDAFAKAVYDKNATRQSADFKEVTKDLVKTATYTAGINGVKDSITSVRGDINNLGARNYFIRKEENVNKIYGWANGNLSGENGSIASDLIEVKEGDTFSSNTLVSQVAFYNSNKTYLGSLQGNNGALSKTSGGTYRNFTVPSGKNIYFMRVTFRNNIMSGIKLDELKVMLNKGNVALDWSPAPEEMLGQADFQVFKGTYEKNDQTIKNRLTSIDSGKDGSILYKANTALSTAKGNTSSITSLNTKVDNYPKSLQNLIQSATSELIEETIGQWGNISRWTVPLSSITSSQVTYSAYLQTNGNNDPLNLRLELFNTSSKSYKPIGITNFGKPQGNGRRSLTVTLGNTSGYDAIRGRISPNSSEDYGYKGFYGQETLHMGNKDLGWHEPLALGKDTFTLFKNDYEETSKGILSRLTAIDSTKEGSVVTRLNKTEKTASGNSQTIATINKNYVKQSNIDASILADKKIKDTRNTNELPPYYYSKYSQQEVREFKLVSVMGIGSGTYGILTTNVPWSDSSGGRVQQTFDTETEKFTRQGSA